MFLEGDKVKFNDCPFDKSKDMNFYNNIQDMVHVVKDVSEDGNLIKTNLIDDWIHRHWFFFFTSNNVTAFLHALGDSNE
jgi:hypothetical protein